jgi:hypothetical protein
VRTFFLRRRWRAQWRAPWRIIAKNSSSDPPRQLPLFFYFCKAFAGPGQDRRRSLAPFLYLSCVGGATYDWLRSILLEHSGISGKNRFNKTCS